MGISLGSEVGKVDRTFKLALSALDLNKSVSVRAGSDKPETADRTV